MEHSLERAWTILPAVRVMSEITHYDSLILEMDLWAFQVTSPTQPLAFCRRPGHANTSLKDTTMTNHLKRLIPTAALTLFFLASCGGTPSKNLEPVRYTGGGSFDQVQSVSISESDTPASVAEQTGGVIVTWHPEDGYAMVGTNSGVSLNGTKPPKAYTIAETNNPQSYGLASWSEGWNVWGSGWSVWGSGSTSWGSGWTVWGSGSTSWGSGTLGNIPAENVKIWQKIKLLEASKLAPKAGEGVKIAVIDSGIDLNHPAFQGVLVGQSDMWDWVDADPTPQDVSGSGSNHGYGHGTAVAGIILQIAPKAKIMPLRVLDASGEGDTANVIAAIDYAVAHGAKVINLSLGTDYDKSLDNTIKSATKAGVFVIAASGNTGDENVTYPASDALVKGMWGEMSLGVGSSDVNDKKSSFSTYGVSLEMMAIGDKVASPAPGGLMGVWNGTSMAAPMVSASFALALAERSYKDLRGVGKVMGLTSDPIDSRNLPYLYKLGYGRLNLERFLSTVLSPSFK
jgi:thermitase